MAKNNSRECAGNCRYRPKPEKAENRVMRNFRVVLSGTSKDVFGRKNGTRERNRTSDQKFRKLLLYPLSYPGTPEDYVAIK